MSAEPTPTWSVGDDGMLHVDTWTDAALHHRLPQRGLKVYAALARDVAAARRLDAAVERLRVERRLIVKHADGQDEAAYIEALDLALSLLTEDTRDLTPKTEDA